MRALLLDVRLRDNLSGEVKPLAQVVETLGCEGIVVPLPTELGLDVTAGGEGLHGLDNLDMKVSVDVEGVCKMVVRRG